MTVLVRRINANPVRTGSEAWDFIVELISTTNSGARVELKKAQGYGASVIAEEYPKERPIVVVNDGPRLRIYCLYGEDAVEGDSSDESSLTWDATEKNWTMYLPVSENDLMWMKKALAKVTSKVIPYGPDDVLESKASSSQSNNDLRIDPEALKKL